MSSREVEFWRGNSRQTAVVCRFRSVWGDTQWVMISFWNRKRGITARTSGHIGGNELFWECCRHCLFRSFFLPSSRWFRWHHIYFTYTFFFQYWISGYGIIVYIFWIRTDFKAHVIFYQNYIFPDLQMHDYSKMNGGDDCCREMLSWALQKPYTC